MRTRVASSDVRGQRTRTRRLVRTSVVLALVPAFLAALAGVAAAAPVAADSMPSGMGGPFSIAAVVIGLGGLIAGLLRHRRRVITSVPPVAPVVPPAPVAEPTGERAA